MVNQNRKRKSDWSESVLKSTATKKVSSVLIFVLIASMLLPVLAFAATGVGFKDGGSFNGTNVTGSVYADTYTNGQKLQVKFFNNGVLVGTYQAVYNGVYENGKYYYDFSTVLSSTYSTVNAMVYDTGVNSAVYKSFTYNAGSGLGVFPGGGSSTSIDATNGYISESQLKSALSSNTAVEIKIKEAIALPAAALVDAKEGAVVTVVGENGTYVLPLSVIDVDALAKKLGVDVKDLKINVEIKKVTGAAAAAVTDAVKEVGAATLSDAVDFNVTAEGKDGKKVAVDFGNTYVKRSINVNKAATKTATVALYNAETGSLSFVPSTVSEKKADFQRTGNSVYVVIENEASFDDVDGHWAKSDIELLASKLVVDGTGEGLFEADRNITRAEFAALAVKALGLTVNSVVYNTYFDDVDADVWYAGYVEAAKKAGLIDGYEDGSFQGDKNITREELSALVVRALKFAGVDTAITSSAQAEALAKFEDSDNIVWAQKEVATAIKLGIVNGVTDTTLATDANATRAESATMLKRLLSKASFI